MVVSGHIQKTERLPWLSLLAIVSHALLIVCCQMQVMVAEALNISRETYFAILMDRACNGPVLVGSPEGGVDIEEVAAKSPELIFKVLKSLSNNTL